MSVVEFLKTLVTYFMAIGGTILALWIVVWLIYKVLVGITYLSIAIRTRSNRVHRLGYSQRGVLIGMAIVIFILVVTLI